jgi:GTP-binding protein
MPLAAPAFRCLCCSPSSARIAPMKIKSAVFDLSSPDLKSCPKWALPEFAFIGRSNVGKSSLINMLAERRELAKVSVTPGKTKLINFFIINDTWSLVDLPGYGYAAVGQGERDQFTQSVSDYLEHRKNIFCVLALIDSRLPPQRIDLQFIRWLVDRSVPYVLVFTKTDKQSATRSQANVDLFTKTLVEGGVEVPEVFQSSAKTKTGRNEILGFIEQTLVTHNRA